MAHWYSTALISLLVLACGNAQEEENSYSASGMESMYYRDGVDVLQKIMGGNYSSLYIQYSGCVWSEYSGEGGEGNDDQEGCGGDENGDGGSWYSGCTQDYRANVAYTLYGIPKGVDASNRGECSEKYYLGSYFTKNGLDGFGDFVGIETEEYGATSECESEEVEEGDNNNNNNNEQENNEGGNMNQYYQNGQGMWSNYMSYTTGCSANGQFESASFQGAYCDGTHYAGSTDSLSSLNSALKKLGCYQIYESDGDEQENDNNEDRWDDEDGPFGLLSYSAPCSKDQYPDSCPEANPDMTRAEAVISAALRKNHGVPMFVPILAIIFVFLAAIVFCMAKSLEKLPKKRLLDIEPAEDRDVVVEDDHETNLLTKVSHSFRRVTTDMSRGARSFKEQIVAYAEDAEEANDDDNDAAAGNYTAPTVEEISTPQVDAESPPSPVASAAASVEETPADEPVVEETRAATTSAPVAEPSSSKKKYKRPRLAKLSKSLFGKK